MNYLKTRNEMITDDGLCTICDEKDFLHRKHCLLNSPGVTHVRVCMNAYSAKVVICGPRDADGKLWWQAPVSKKVYDIERLGHGRDTHFVLSEHGTGRTILDGRLSDATKYIVDNQGVL